jgi:hypothetical protein
MTNERLLAAALWLDELEAQRATAVSQKWAALGEEFDKSDDGVAEAYQARDAELDEALLRPLRARLLEARRLLQERAAAIATRETWPAGGSWLARAQALARSLASSVDSRAVEDELAALRRQ